MRDFEIVNAGVLSDPRARVIWVDGRNHVLSTRDRYDLILSDSIHPPLRRQLQPLHRRVLHHVSREARAGRAGLHLVADLLAVAGQPERDRGQHARGLPAHFAWYLNSTVNEFVVLIGRTEGPESTSREWRQPLPFRAFRESLASIGLTSTHALLDFFVAQGRDPGSFRRRPAASSRRSTLGRVRVGNDPRSQGQLARELRSRRGGAAFGDPAAGKGPAPTTPRRTPAGRRRRATNSPASGPC